MSTVCGIPSSIFWIMLLGGPGAILFSLVLINSTWWKKLINKYYTIDMKD